MSRSVNMSVMWGDNTLYLYFIHYSVRVLYRTCSSSGVVNTKKAIHSHNKRTDQTHHQKKVNRERSATVERTEKNTNHWSCIMCNEDVVGRTNIQLNESSRAHHIKHHTDSSSKVFYFIWYYWLRPFVSFHFISFVMWMNQWFKSMLLCVFGTIWQQNKTHFFRNDRLLTTDWEGW